METVTFINLEEFVLLKAKSIYCDFEFPNPTRGDFREVHTMIFGKQVKMRVVLKLSDEANHTIRLHDSRPPYVTIQSYAFDKNDESIFKSRRYLPVHNIDEINESTSPSSCKHHTIDFSQGKSRKVFADGISITIRVIFTRYEVEEESRYELK